MDAGSPALLAAAALGLFAACAPVVVWLARRHALSPADPQAAARRRTRRARQRGWEYDETAVGDTVFTLRGQEEGVKWKIRYRADPSRPDARPPTLSWATSSVQGSVTELRLIGRARYERGKAHGEPVIEKLSSLILSPRKIALAQARSEFVERTKPAKVGTEALRERFVVLARNRRLARALVDEKLESLLLRWGRVTPPPEDVLSIWVDWQGLRIDVDAPWTGMREIEHLVALGLALANGYRRHAAAPGVTRWMEETQPGTLA
jgi:hypothetical protein